MCEHCGMIIFISFDFNRRIVHILQWKNRMKGKKRFHFHNFKRLSNTDVYTYFVSNKNIIGCSISYLVRRLIQVNIHFWIEMVLILMEKNERFLGRFYRWRNLLYIYQIEMRFMYVNERITCLWTVFFLLRMRCVAISFNLYCLCFDCGKPVIGITNRVPKIVNDSCWFFIDVVIMTNLEKIFKQIKPTTILYHTTDIFKMNCIFLPFNWWLILREYVYVQNCEKIKT